MDKYYRQTLPVMDKYYRQTLPPRTRDRRVYAVSSGQTRQERGWGCTLRHLETCRMVEVGARRRRKKGRRGRDEEKL